jgi:hypothetical protein
LACLSNILTDESKLDAAQRKRDLMAACEPAFD